MNCPRCLSEETCYLGDWEDEPGKMVSEFQCEPCLYTWQIDFVPEPGGSLADDPENYESKA